MMMKRNVFLTMLICAFATCVSDAAVVPRNSRASIARMPTLSAQSAKTTDTNTQTDEVVEQESEVVDTPVVENKSSLFDETIGEAITTNSDLAANELAEQIRAQRAALDAADVWHVCPKTSMYSVATSFIICPYAPAYVAYCPPGAFFIANWFFAKTLDYDEFKRGVEE